MTALHPAPIPWVFDAPVRLPSIPVRAVLAYLRGDRPVAQLVRFAAVGGVANIGYLLLFLSLHTGGTQLANTVASLASTALANDLHRRVSFHASARVGWWTAQWEGGAMAVAGLAAGALSLAAVKAVAPGIDPVVQALTVIAVGAAVGLARFLALRLLWRRRSPARHTPARLAPVGAGLP